MPAKTVMGLVSGMDSAPSQPQRVEVLGTLTGAFAQTESEREGSVPTNAGTPALPTPTAHCQGLHAGLAVFTA